MATVSGRKLQSGRHRGEPVGLLEEQGEQEEHPAGAEPQHERGDVGTVNAAVANTDSGSNGRAARRSTQTNTRPASTATIRGTMVAG